VNILQRAKQALMGKDRLSEDFDRTLSVKIRVGDRVRHRTTRELGHCYQTGLVNGSVRVPAISVRYDNGHDAILAPAEEFMKATKY
jgi:hypothetical protein